MMVTKYKTEACPEISTTVKFVFIYQREHICLILVGQFCSCINLMVNGKEEAATVFTQSGFFEGVVFF